MTYNRAGYLASKFLAVLVFLALVRVMFFLPLIWTYISTALASERGHPPSQAYVQIGTLGICVVALIYMAIRLWVRADSFVPQDPQDQQAQPSEDFVEGLAFRMLGTYFVVSSIDDMLSPNLRSLLLDSLLARLPGPVVGIIIGVVLQFRGKAIQHRIKGEHREGIFRRAANWLWNPPLDDEEENGEQRADG